MKDYSIFKYYTEESAVDLYQKILDGELDKFPQGFWDQPNAHKFSKPIIRHLFGEVLKFNHEEIANKANVKLFYQFKLSSMLSKLYGNSSIKAINNAYPLKFHPWEIGRVPEGYWNDKENGVKAMKWLIDEKLKWSDDEIKNKLNSKIIQENKLSTMLSVCFNGSTYSGINAAYPNKFKPWELKITPQNYWTHETGIEATRWLFDEKLKWDFNNKDTMIKKSLFVENGLSGMLQVVFDNSMYKALQSSYPECDWEMFNLPK